MVRMSEVVALLDAESAMAAPASREFLGFMRSRGRVEDVSGGTVKALVVLKDRVVLSGISASTLRRRVGVLDGFPEGDEREAKGV